MTDDAYAKWTPALKLRAIAAHLSYLVGRCMSANCTSTSLYVDMCPLCKESVDSAIILRQFADRIVTPEDQCFELPCPELSQSLRVYHDRARESAIDRAVDCIVKHAADVGKPITDVPD